jgi:hypothetical protein
MKLTLKGKGDSAVAYLLKARTMEPDKQTLQGNGYLTRNNAVTVRSGVFFTVRAEAI